LAGAPLLKCGAVGGLNGQEILAQMPTDTKVFHNGSSGFGGNADSAEVADVALVYGRMYSPCRLCGR